jgi:hypothetical protein
VACDGFQWRLAAVAAVARGNPARGRDAGQLVSARATLEPRGATGVFGRRRARAVSSSTVRRRQLWGKHAVARRGGASDFYKRLGTPAGDEG